MKLLRTFSLYTVVGFLNAGIGFLLLPILTRFLSPEDYGIISLINTYVSFLIPIIGMSIAGYMGVEYYNKNISKSSYKSLLSSSLLVPIALAFPIGVLLIIFNSFFSEILELPKLACFILIPLALIVLYQDVFISFLIITKRSTLFSVSTLSRLIVEIPLSIIFIVYVGLQWEGRIFALAIMSLLIAGIGLFLFNKWGLITGKFEKKYIINTFAFGLPLVLHQVGKFTVDQSDRLFLAKMVSVKEMGVYSVGYQIGMIMLILISAFSNFFSPYFLEGLNNITEKKKAEIVKVSYGFIGLLFLFLIVITLLTPTLFAYVIDERFLGGEKYVFWIGLGFFFWGIYMVFSGYIFFMKKNKVLGYLAILNIVVNLLCNYFFIQWFGAIGAAYATCLSYAIISLIIVYISQKLYPMPWFSFYKINNDTIT